MKGPMHAGQDPLHRASSERAGEANARNRECAAVRRALGKYLAGRVFPYRRARIERHLAVCERCRSEYQALARQHDTQELLREIHAQPGIMHRMWAGATSVGRMTRILYRPLWLAGLAAALLLLYLLYTSWAPSPARQLDSEISRMVGTAPTPSTPVGTAPRRQAPLAAPAGTRH